MIEQIEVKEWVVTRGREEYIGNKKICKVALKICDKCGKREEVQYENLKVSRRKRKSEKDYCQKCANSERVYTVVGKSPNWKHGKTVSGYDELFVDKKKILKHVHLMELELGRKIIKGECVHHIDMDKSNSVIENLYLFNSQRDHQLCHVSMEKLGFSLFGKFIWFDRQQKEYVLYYVQEVEMPEVIIPKFYNRYLNGNYWKIFYENEFGEKETIFEHRLIAGLARGKPLQRGEFVHHIDGCSTNNSPNNLFVVTNSEHMKYHSSLQRIVANLYKSGVVKFNNGLYSLNKDD